MYIIKRMRVQYINAVNVHHNNQAYSEHQYKNIHMHITCSTQTARGAAIVEHVGLDVRHRVGTPRNAAASHNAAAQYTTQQQRGQLIVCSRDGSTLPLVRAFSEDTCFMLFLLRLILGRFNVDIG